MASSNDNIKSAIIKVGEINEEIKKLTDAKKDLELIVREAIADGGELIADNFRAECKTVAGRKTLDKDLLANAGIDLEPYYTLGKPYTRLTIKRVNIL